MDHNKHNLKVGDTVILDKDFSNGRKVRITGFTPKQLFATVYTIDDPKQTVFEVMTYRLSPVENIKFQ